MNHNNLSLAQCNNTGKVFIGGKSIKHHVERLGQTPCYLYDRSCIRNRIRYLKNLLNNNIDVYYAIKSNPMQPIIDLVRDEVDGFDISSAGELNKALDSGMPGKNIHFAGPGKKKEELYRSVVSGVLVNIESEREIDLLSEISETSSIRARVSFRVNPKFETRFSGMVMGGKSSQFGIDEERVPELIKKAQSLGLDVVGLHYFLGSQVLNSETIISTQNACYKSANNIKEATQCQFKIINLGGGFGIPYFKSDKPLNVEIISENMNKLSTQAKIDFGDDTRIKIELGRYIVGPAGVYVTKAIDKKNSRDLTYIVVDGGMHHHLAASGNLGQFLHKNYPMVVHGKLGLSEVVNIVGPLCTPLDMLAKNIELPKFDLDDLLVIFSSGAYGKSASPSDFLSHPNAVEALI